MTAPAEISVAPATAQSFDDSIRPIMPSLLAYFARRVDPADDAADCLSETMIVVWRRRSELPTDADGQRAWCFGIAKGVLANHLRSQLRRSRLSSKLRTELVHSAPGAHVPSADPALDDALASLSADDRELVLLITWDGFGVAEAGAILGLKPDAARARYSRARRSLRELLS